MQFWDEIDQFPAVHMAAGSETREYYGGGNKWRFLNISLRVYVNSEDPVDELEEIYGVGKAKLEKFGKDFLNIISDKQV